MPSTVTFGDLTWDHVGIRFKGNSSLRNAVNSGTSKPEGNGGTFASGTYSDDEMEKKNNKKEGDYSDVSTLYEIINSDNRITDVVSWKSDLEQIFNVDGFLKWLAANTVMQNWDTYGNMSHNYYLYNNPETGKLNWIPWDNNESLQDGKVRPLNLSLMEIDRRWPLIRYLIDDFEYKTVYDDYIIEFTKEVFNGEKMVETYNNYYKMIKEYAYDEMTGYSYIRSDQSFDSAVEELKSHVEQRNNAVQNYLKS